IISTTSKLFSSDTHFNFYWNKLYGSSPTSPELLPTNFFLHSLHNVSLGSNRRNYWNNKEVFHDPEIFLENFKEMNSSFKIYVYRHKRDDPFANVFLPVNYLPWGNYASEHYFKKLLLRSHFITKDPYKAHLFYLPFSISRMRQDPRIGAEGIQDFVKDYISDIRQRYPYWNRTGGADHFYVACHSTGRTAMDKAVEVKINAIQLVCSSSYFLRGYVAHKDASMPQIWPREGDPPDLSSVERDRFAFFAGAVNCRVRQRLVELWGNDTDIYFNAGRLKTSYTDEFLRSKFCLHVRGHGVNTARISDSLYYGCVPVILANYYDVPYIDMLNWKSFSVVVNTRDIPLLKDILHEISSGEYKSLQDNGFKVRKHFQWHPSPIDFDAFSMAMYELWLRRSSVKIKLETFVYFS
ncbi:Exostosin domain-containing protein, partial [Cephalotus follicularis]